MNILLAYQKFWRKGFDFTGLSSRADFWCGILAHFVVMFIIAWLEAFISQEAVIRPASGPIIAFYLFSSFFPSLCITVRRLRDSGRNWPWILLVYIPFIGLICLIFLLIQPSIDNGRFD